MLPTPCYIVYEDRLRANLELISSVSRRSGAKIIMAFKANALWRTFPIMREYGLQCTASSVNELLLGVEELNPRVHSYCPAYTPETIGKYLAHSSHITFNSVSQWKRFKGDVEAHNANASEERKGITGASCESTLLGSGDRHLQPCASGESLRRRGG